MTISVCFDADSSLHDKIPSGYKSRSEMQHSPGPVYSAQRFQDKTDISADHRACTLPDPARCRPLLPLLLLLSDVTLARRSS